MPIYLFVHNKRIRFEQLRQIRGFYLPKTRERKKEKRHIRLSATLSSNLSIPDLKTKYIYIYIKNGEKRGIDKNFLKIFFIILDWENA